METQPESLPPVSSRRLRRSPAGWFLPLRIRRLRSLSVAVLLLVSWDACHPWEIALAMQLPDPIRRTHTEQAWRSLEQGLRAIDLAARKASDHAAAPGRVAAADLGELDRLGRPLKTADGPIRESFARVGRHLASASLPEILRQRHRDAEAKYSADFEQLQSHLATLRTAPPGSAEQAAELRRLRAFLDRRVTPDRHQALDPQQLPHRLAVPQARAPRLAAERFDLPVEARRAAAPNVPVAGLSTRAALPGPADLAPTVDAALTTEIRAQAASLDHSPLKIYDWVRNQIDFTPTHGSIQGAVGCLRARLCNATDSASLLIALLRAAGVPARYVLGTIEAPIDTVANWAGGFENGEAALSFIAASGTAATGLTSGGELVAARLEHVWVEAFLDFLPSRGAAPALAGDTWVPLDPSFKRFSHTAGIDLAAATDVDSVATFGQLFAAATVADPDGGVTDFDLTTMAARLAEARQDIRAYLDARPELSSLADLVGGRQVVPQASQVAAGSLPYRVLVRAGAVPELPAALRHRLSLEVFAGPDGLGEAGLVFEASLPELASRKLTLSYAPATAADEALLVSLLPAGGDPAGLPASLPAYLVRVKPELRLEGAVVATGEAVTLGAAGRVRLALAAPGEDARVVDNTTVAGAYSALVLHLGRPEAATQRIDQAEAIQARVEAGDVAGLTKDDVVGEALYSAGLLYWSELDLFSRLAAQQQGVASARMPSQGFFSYDLEVSTVFGTPVSVRPGAMTTDVDSDVQAVVGRDGDAARPVDFLAVGGALASRAEAAIWDQLLSAEPTGQGVSAVSYLEAAARQGIPIFHIDAANLGQALGDLEVPAAIKTDITNAVAAGRMVTIPQRELLKDGFFGIGYVVFDPETGAGGYFISGGLAGGGMQLPPLHPLVTYLIGIVLVGLGIFATGFVAILLAALSVVAIGYDTVATVQGLDPSLGPEAREFVINFLEGLAMIGALVAVVGIFSGSVLLFVVFAVFWTFVSLIASNLLVSLMAAGNFQPPEPPQPVTRQPRSGQAWPSATARLAFA